MTITEWVSEEGLAKKPLWTPKQAIEQALKEQHTPTAMYYDLCDHFVARMYGYAYSGYASAITHWESIPWHGVVPTNPADNLKSNANWRGILPGALCFFTVPHTTSGHVCLFYQGNVMISNDVKRPGRIDGVTFEEMREHWGDVKFLGWAKPDFYASGGTNGLTPPPK